MSPARASCGTSSKDNPESSGQYRSIAGTEYPAHKQLQKKGLIESSLKEGRLDFGARSRREATPSTTWVAVLAITPPSWRKLSAPEGAVVAAEIEPDLAAQALENIRAYPTARPLGKGFMVKVTRAGGQFAAAVISMVAIYSSLSVRDTAIEMLLGKAFESRELFKTKSVRLDPHEPAATCIAHSPSVCLSAEAPDSA